MLVAKDKPVNLEILVEVYCDKTSQGFPNTKDNLIKMANRMRSVGLLTETEHKNLEHDAEKIVKEHKA